ncbi:uncharacterized protein MONBRDRAFT_32779 [Monosiga brevicollis MX1]|uniref:Chorismate synthase n=1 Tax=Monosiga brevicollis TaxID=81824 RepID=A9V1N2_MONBE|nr:uncharacterized protein MONBRDRAFT_32779 [Monosiga brevicollis MX1]EDQ88595.1 predicted protein [Monosiga brevicollis MX1]|eukprot:XP_001746699.1 hypothetical protein [Monosiga brevicollis MX1]
MSTFGTYFRVTTFGESHCKGVGAIVDGVPPRLALTEEDVQPQLTRRRPGQSKLTTPRNESDRVTIMSGTEFGRTLGTPIGLFVPNQDQRPKDYGSTSHAPRPSHADFTYMSKYGTHASSGGGRSSARETIGRVAGGAIAEKWLREAFGIEIVAWVSAVGSETESDVDVDTITREQVDEHLPVRSGTAEAVERFSNVIKDCKAKQDSTGGVVSCVCRNVPAGWGEPCFDKLEAKLAHAMMSIPATKGFEVGSGFSGTRMRGSTHNDLFVKKGDGLGTATNNSGGIQGGISNGENIVFRIAFKPPATIGQQQQSVNFQGEDDVVAAKGRHDPCVVPRAIPIVEAMAALVLADLALAQLARRSAGDLATPVVGGDNDERWAQEHRLRLELEQRLRRVEARPLVPASSPSAWTIGVGAAAVGAALAWAVIHRVHQ